MAPTSAGGSAEQNYTMGYSAEFQALLRRRNPEHHARHLLPHLKPGMRVLDLGCGPGTISVGLAKLIEPGELHGVDLEESQIVVAQEAAAAGGHENAVFRAASATALPYEDESFDVVHSHTLLMHVPDTEAVMRETLRVLKPGGLVSGRDMIGASSFLEPASDKIDEAWRTFTFLIRANGGHPDMGRTLKRVFADAGLVDLEASASFDFYSTPEDVAFFHQLVVGWFFAPATRQAAEAAGLATAAQFDAWRAEFDGWADRPDAVSGTAFGEAVGRKPS